MTHIGFKRGPYGEIFPPPLVGGVDPDEALDRLVQAAEQSGNPITALPKRGQSRKGMYNLALLHIHQVNLARAIAGDMDDPDAVTLRQLVVEQREALSLRPLGLESLWFTTFAPVLQLVDPQTDTWRVGLPGHGRTASFQAGPDEAVKRAQHLYVEWSADEDAKWQNWVQQTIGSVKPTYQHLVWQAQLTANQDLLAHLTNGYGLQRLGKHTTYSLITPKGQRIFDASSLPRALRIADAFLANQGVALPDYSPSDVMEALLLLGADRPTAPQDDGVWSFTQGLRAKRLGDNAFGLKMGERRFGLRMADGNLFTLVELRRNKMDRRLGDLIVSNDWSPEDRMQVGLTWAAWVIGKRR